VIGHPWKVSLDDAASVRVLQNVMDAGSPAEFHEISFQVVGVRLAFS
jgi:hypothetical protein